MKEIKKEIMDIVKQSIFLEENYKLIDKASQIMADTIKSGGRVILAGVGSSRKAIDLVMEEIEDWYGFVDKEFINIFNDDVVSTNFSVSDRKDFESLHFFSSFLFKEYKINEKDCLVTLSTSGKTDFISNSLKLANEVGAKRILLTNSEEKIEEDNLFVINLPSISPFVPTTLLPQTLGVLITGTSDRLGRMYNGWNLFMGHQRGKEISQVLAILDKIKKDKEVSSSELLDKYGFKTAFIMLRNNVDAKEAKKIIKENKYNLSNKIK